MNYIYHYKEREPIEAHPEITDKHQLSINRGPNKPKVFYGEICAEYLEHISRGGIFQFSSNGRTYSLGAPEKVLVEGGYAIGYPVMCDDKFVKGMDVGVGMFLDILSEDYAKQRPVLIKKKACGSENYKKFLEQHNPLCVFIPLNHLESYANMVYVKAVESLSLN